MVKLNLMDNVKQILQELILPEFKNLLSEFHRLDDKITSFREEFRTEIRRLDEKIDNKIDRLDEKLGLINAQLAGKIDSLRDEMRSEIRRVDNRIDSLEKSLTIAIDLHERIAVMEEKLSH